jgi:citrate lyase subunit beta/citryl-CoA lyase
MPGSNARALEKAKSLAADALIFDLEDAVAPDAKEQARVQVIAALAAGGFGRREILLRVNGLAGPCGYADLLAAAGSRADAVLLPKVESADAVRQADTILSDVGAPEAMALWCMMETPMGILKAEEIATASRRMAGFVMGTSDLAKDLHCAHTRERLPLLGARGRCLLVARAYGLAILDGVHLDLADDEGFEHACRQGVELGFDGKTLIHPKTIDAANRLFGPSAGELAWSARVIAAHAEASAAGKGVVVVDGKLVENLHVASARRIIALAEQIVALQSDLKAPLAEGR